jgi:hypothetical protein
VFKTELETPGMIHCPPIFAFRGKTGKVFPQRAIPDDFDECTPGISVSGGLIDPFVWPSTFEAIKPETFYRHSIDCRKTKSLDCE